MVRSTDADDAKMLLEILFPMSYVIIDQLALNLVDIWFNNTLHKKSNCMLVWGNCFEALFTYIV